MAFFAKAVVVGLDADPKDLEKGFDRAGKKLDEFEGKAGSSTAKAGASFVNLGSVVNHAIGNVVASAFTTATSAVSSFVSDSVKEFSNYQKSMTTLEIVSPKFGQSADKAKEVARQLSEELNLGLGTTGEGLQNLFKSGLNIDQATDMMRRFHNEAITGKSANIGMDEAMRNLTFSYNTQNSAIGNLSGISENYSDIEAKGLKVLQSKGQYLGLTIGKLDDAAKKEAQYAGMIALTDLTLGSSNKFKGTWIDTEAKLHKAITDTQIALGSMLEPALNATGKAMLPVVNNMKEMVKSFHVEDLKQVAPIFVGIGVATLASMIPSTVAITGFGVAVWAAMAPLLPFVALAAGIAAAIYLIQQNWSVLQPYFDQFATMAMSVLNPALQFLGNMITTQLVPAFNNMLTALKPVWEFIEPMLLPALKILGAIIGVVIVGSILLFIGALMMIVQNLTAVAQGVTAFCQMVQFGWTNMTTILGTVWNAIWDTIKSYTAAVFLSLYYIFTGQSDKVAGVWSAFGTKINEIWSGAWATVSGYLAGVWGQIGGHFEALGANITGFFAGVNLEQMGKDMIQGLINGLQSMGSSLINSITGLVNNAVNAAKNALGIHSPSVLLKEEIGINMMKGINEGLVVEAPRVQNTLEDKLMAMSQIRIPSAQISDQITGSYSSSRVQTNSVDSHDTYVTNNNNEPKDRPGFGWLETA
jgi:phage-related protein